MKRTIVLVAGGLAVLSLAASAFFVSNIRAESFQIREAAHRDQQQTVKYNLDLTRQLDEAHAKQKRLERKNKQLEKDLQAKRAAAARLAATRRAAGRHLVSNGTKPIPASCASYRSLFARHKWDVRVAMAIMQAESSCDAGNTSPSDDHGLMQIHGGLATYGQKIYDPAFNIRIAFEQKYLKGGWSHWTVYKTGAYLKYL